MDFEQATKSLLEIHGDTLIRVAAASIERGLNTSKPLNVDLADYPHELSNVGASFVTLKRGGNLRGCIGSPAAHRPLLSDVAENAFSAAFRDPRFAKLTKPEIDRLTLSISVLSPQSPIEFTSEQDLLDSLRPQVDGLVIEDSGKRALFLPSVWSQLPRPETFVEHLKRKAGMQPSHWSEAFRAWRFIAEEIHDHEIDPSSGPLWSV